MRDAPTNGAAGTREPRTVPLNDRLTWRLADIVQATGLARRTLERLRSAGRFPAPDLHVGALPLWKPETIRAWVEGGGTK
jgi:predicted DNA-binding transcriptional regulator AlpA